MSNTTWGVVKEGVVIPDTALPEGARVEIAVPDGPLVVPPELQAEFDAWDLASAQTLAEVERLALEDETDAQG
jgi:hypothetical protein